MSIEKLPTETRSEQEQNNKEVAKEAIEETVEDMHGSGIENMHQDTESFGMENHVEVIESIVSQYEPRVVEAGKGAEYHSRGASQMARDWPSVYHRYGGVYVKKFGGQGYSSDLFEGVGARIGAVSMNITEKFHKFMSERLKGQAEGIFKEGKSKTAEYMESKTDSGAAIREELRTIENEIEPRVVPTRGHLQS